MLGTHRLDAWPGQRLLSQNNVVCASGAKSGRVPISKLLQSVVERGSKWFWDNGVTEERERPKAERYAFSFD